MQTTNKKLIHKTAEISPQAKIGAGTKIWHNSQVLENARIGKNCVIGHNCLIGAGVLIGNGVKIQSNTDVWNKVTLKDYVFVGPSAVFTNDSTPRSKYPKSKEQWRPTLAKEGATIGANATIVCGTTIGKWAFVAAGAVVCNDVPDHALVAGVPAKPIGWICECANKLTFKNSRAVCKICGKIYSKKGNKITRVK